MVSLPEEYNHSQCEIKTLQNEPLMTGSINRITNDCIEIVNPNDKLPILACNTYVKFGVYSRNGQFQVLVGKVYLSTCEFIRVVDTTSVTDFEKRSFFRVSVRKEAQAYVPNAEEESPPTVLPWFPITVKDLSLSGMLFRTEQNLTEGDKIELQMELCKTNLVLQGIIIRKTADEPYCGLGYGCKFIQNKDAEMNLLSRCIFELQREEIQRIRQKMEI